MNEMATSAYSSAFIELKSLEFYNYKTTTCHASVTKSTKFNTVYIGISKDSNYTDDQNNPKHSWNNILLPFSAAKRLHSILGGLVEEADKVIKSASEGVYDSSLVCHN